MGGARPLHARNAAVAAIAAHDIAAGDDLAFDERERALAHVLDQVRLADVEDRDGLPALEFGRQGSPRCVDFLFRLAVLAHQHSVRATVRVGALADVEQHPLPLCAPGTSCRCATRSPLVAVREQRRERQIHRERTQRDAVNWLSRRRGVDARNRRRTPRGPARRRARSRARGRERPRRTGGASPRSARRWKNTAFARPGTLTKPNARSSSHCGDGRADDGLLRPTVPAGGGDARAGITTPVGAPAALSAANCSSASANSSALRAARRVDREDADRATRSQFPNLRRRARRRRRPCPRIPRRLGAQLLEAGRRVAGEDGGVRAQRRERRRAVRLEPPSSAARPRPLVRAESDRERGRRARQRACVASSHSTSKRHGLDEPHVTAGCRARAAAPAVAVEVAQRVQLGRPQRVVEVEHDELGQDRALREPVNRGPQLREVAPLRRPRVERPAGAERTAATEQSSVRLVPSETESEQRRADQYASHRQSQTARACYPRSDLCGRDLARASRPSPPSRSSRRRPGRFYVLSAPPDVERRRAGGVARVRPADARIDLYFALYIEGRITCMPWQSLEPQIKGPDCASTEHARPLRHDQRGLAHYRLCGGFSWTSIVPSVRGVAGTKLVEDARRGSRGRRPRESGWSRMASASVTD